MKSSVTRSVLLLSLFALHAVYSASWFDTEQWRYAKKTCKCSCGVSRKDEQRVVGGRPTEAYDYPWMAGLLFKGSIYCGGTLINDRYVATAAHCVAGLPIDEINIILGVYDLLSDDQPSLQLKSIVSAVIHPKFVSKTFNNDIAILKLNSPVKFSYAVGPVCLPQFQKSYTGQIGVVTGWGRINETSSISPLLRQVEVPIFSNPECQKTKYGVKAITDNMMCAGYDNGKLDACQGDSGGPLHLMGKDQKIDLIGIVSWGQGCGRPGFPGVYTRIGRYLEWIAENTADACYCGRRTGRYSFNGKKQI